MSSPQVRDRSAEISLQLGDAAISILKEEIKTYFNNRWGAGAPVLDDEAGFIAKLIYGRLEQTLDGKRRQLTG